ETELKAFAVIPWTSPSWSSVITVMPVAKLPIALRNSGCVTLMGAWILGRRDHGPLIVRSITYHVQWSLSGPLVASFMYDSAVGELPRAEQIPNRATLSPVTETKAQPKALSSYLAEVNRGLPMTRAVAYHLIACSDNDLPELLAAARAAKE